MFSELVSDMFSFRNAICHPSGVGGRRDITLLPVWKQLRRYINSYHFRLFPQPCFLLFDSFYWYLTAIGMMLHQSPPTKQVLLYKTEYCRNWTELGYCRHVNDDTYMYNPPTLISHFIIYPDTAKSVDMLMDPQSYETHHDTRDTRLKSVVLIILKELVPMASDALISTICHFPTIGLSYLYHHHALILAFSLEETVLEAVTAVAVLVVSLHPPLLLHSSLCHHHLG